MKSKYLVFLMLFLSILVFSDIFYFVSPGIKLGIRFGRTPAVSPGIELSGGAIFPRDDQEGNYFGGLVLGWQRNTIRKGNLFRREALTYWEFEGGYISEYFSAGGALGREKSRTFGANPRIRVFGGYLGYVAIVIPMEQGIYQVDAGLKYPFLFSGDLVPENKFGIF